MNKNQLKKYTQDHFKTIRHLPKNLILLFNNGTNKITANC